jgi:hypothetical protein
MKIVNEQNRNKLGFRYVCSLKHAYNIKVEPTKKHGFIMQVLIFGRVSILGLDIFRLL